MDLSRYLWFRRLRGLLRFSFIPVTLLVILLGSIILGGTSYPPTTESVLEPAANNASSKVTNVTTVSDYVRIGTDVEFIADGDNLSTVTWTSGGIPEEGTGTTFKTKWNTPGEKTVTATCGTTKKSKTVKVVELLRLSLDNSSNPAWEGTNNSFVAVKKRGEKVVIKATTNPNEPGAWDLIEWDEKSGDAVPSKKNKRSVSKDSSGRTDVNARIGTSSKTKKIVVVWATFTNFQKAGPKPDDSDVAPELWGVPADDGANGALIQATVDPVDAADYGVTFDFQRTMEQVEWKKESGTWTKISDISAGTDDDKCSEDEDPTPSGTGHIYSVHNLGWITEPPLAAWESAFQAGSFIESVSISVGENTINVSDDYPWHGFIWLDKTNGTWTRHGTLNQIGPESRAINHMNPPTAW